MNVEKTVRCKVCGFRYPSKTQNIAFCTGPELNMASAGEIGPKGITTTAADLVDFAAAVYQIERLLRGSQLTNPPKQFEVSMQLRDPSAWNSKAIKAAHEILLLLGNAEWFLEFQGGLRAEIPEHQPVDRSRLEQVVLFSGGMDSTCGLASVQKDAAGTRLVYFSTGRKTLQRDIAKQLEFSTPILWSRDWRGEKGRTRTFYYRSFLFLCLAAAVAESWEARTILQFENGVLASAIPPSPAWMMTKHAHPRLLKLASKLFSALFGGEWRVKNPFWLDTKRACFNKAAGAIGEAEAKEIVQKTMTCWFHWSNRVIGGKKKKPGRPCGVCIPCIVRRTGLQYYNYEWDLREDHVRNDPHLGMSFRSYFGFLEQVAKTENSPAEFYRLLPASGRSLVAPNGEISLQDLHTLFLQFSKEFMETYQ